MSTRGSMPRKSSSRRRRLLRWAAVLQLVQGILMEGLVLVGLLVLLALQLPQSAVTDRVDIFALEFLQSNLYLMMAMSGVFAALRVAGAVGLWKNRLWGLALSIVNCVVTLALMIFMLPAGIADGILSGAALVLMLMGWFGSRPITSVDD